MCLSVSISLPQYLFLFVCLFFSLSFHPFVCPALIVTSIFLCHKIIKLSQVQTLISFSFLLSTSLSYLFNAVFSPSLVPLRHSNARADADLVEAGAYHTASAISSHPGEHIDNTLDSQNRAFSFFFNLKTLLRNIEHSPKRGHIKKKNRQWEIPLYV